MRVRVCVTLLSSRLFSGPFTTPSLWPVPPYTLFDVDLRRRYTLRTSAAQCMHAVHHHANTTVDMRFACFGYFLEVVIILHYDITLEKHHRPWQRSIVCVQVITFVQHVLRRLLAHRTSRIVLLPKLTLWQASCQWSCCCLSWEF